MAIAVTATHLISNATAASGPTSFATASISPSPGKLVIATIKSYKTGSTPAVPTLTGASMTWTQVLTRRGSNDPDQRITVFRALSGSPGSGALTIDFGVQAPGDNVFWSITEFGNVDTAGTNGSAAVVQSASNDVAGGSGITVTLAAFSGTGNATHGVAVEYGTNAITKGAAFTQLFNSTLTGGVVCSQWVATNQTSVNWSCSSPPQLLAIALEIKVQPPSGGGFLYNLV